MAGVTGRAVTQISTDEDVANANNPQHAAKGLAEGGDSREEDDDDLRNRNANKSSNIEMSGMASNSKTPLPGPSGSNTAVTVARTKSEKEKKMGHRRVTQGGDVTYKKIQTSQIMGSIQLGVQHAIGGLASKPERDLLMQDFMTVEQTFFPSGGSNQTPAHHYSDFRFKTYAPIAFRYFRDLFGIQPDDFLMSMCSVPMRELSNPGASGSIFYLTDDDEFIVKTVQHKECEFLQKLLPGYYMNLNQNPRTLLPKFFGLFNYQCNSKNVRLVVMNNLLPSSVRMHQKYDLKGSTYKRKASKTEREKAYPTFKDLDFVEHHPEGLLLEADTCVALMKTLQRDCRVLESFKIMDYSLLVGVHNLDIAAKEKAERKAKMLDSDDDEDEVGEYTPGTGLSRSKSINRQKLVAHSTALESIQAESEPIDADEDVPPGGIPARNAKGERLLLFLGLIDILQSYRLKKKLEHTFKAMIHDGDTVSVHRPGFYAERFMNFMTKSVFRKIPSLDLPEIKGNHRKFRNLVSTYLALKHSPSKKRGPPLRLRGEQDGEYLGGSPPQVTSPLSPASLAASPPRSSTSPQTEFVANKRNSSGAQVNVNVREQVAQQQLQQQQQQQQQQHQQLYYHHQQHQHHQQQQREQQQQRNGEEKNGSEGQQAQQQQQQQQPQQPMSPPASYPAILNQQARPSSMNRGKIPPPVPPRTPKRSSNNGADNKGMLEGSPMSTPLPLSTPPPPFQENVYGRGVGNRQQQQQPAAGTSSSSSGQQQQQWNLNSQSPSRRFVGGGGGGSGAGSSNSSTEHHPRHHMTDSETVSISEVYVETRMHRSSLSVASSSTTSGVSSSLGHRMPRSPPTGVHDFSRNTSATPTWTEGTPSFTESSSSGDLGEDYLGCPTTPVKGAEGGGGEAGGSGRRAGRPSGADDDNIEVLDTEHEMVRKRNASSGAY